jgi:hypothetical protein
MDLYNVLPHDVKEKFGRRLAEEDEELSNIEGQIHLTAMLKELKLHYRTVETAVSNTPLPPPPSTQKGKQAQATHSTTFSKQPPRPGNSNNGYGKGQGQGQNAQQSNKKGNHNVKSPHVPNPTPMPLSNLPRWTCPLSDHENHTLQSCSEFFNIQ